MALYFFPTFAHPREVWTVLLRRRPDSIKAEHEWHRAIAKGSRVRTNSLHGTPDFPARGKCGFGRTGREDIGDVGNNNVSQAREICGFPVAAVTTLGKQSVVKRLDGPVWHSATEIENGLAERP